LKAGFDGKGEMKGNEYIFEVTWERLGDFARKEGERLGPETTLVEATKKLNGSAQ
jgi:hypothetical protein